LGDLIMVRRKQAGISHKQLALKTGIKIHWFRRWEFDRAVPTQSEWQQVRRFVSLPPSPILTFTQAKTRVQTAKSLGEQLRKRRVEMKLCIAEAAPKMGVSEFTLWSWETDRTFPKLRYHAPVTTFLGYNPFP